MTLRQRGLRLLRRRPAAGTALLLFPGTAWLFLFFALPLLLVIGASVMTRGTYGGVQPSLTLTAYHRLLDPLYLGILGRSLLWSALATLAALALGVPVAWVIARSRRYRHLLLFLVVLPFWTSFLVRTFALIFLLRDGGVVNSLLLWLGLLREPLPLLYTPFAVLLGLVYGLLPLMVLPVYASLEKLDPGLLEAAGVLGARPAVQFRTVTLPLARPGIVAGSLLVFVAALGSFLTADLLGGAKQIMVGNLVQNQFTTARDWPFGSAISLALLALVLATVLFSLRWRDAAEPAGLPAAQPSSPSPR